MSTLSRALSYGGVALPAGAIYGGVEASVPLGAAVAVALLGVVLLGVRAYLGGVRLPVNDRTRTVARKAAAPALVVVLVGSLVATGVAPSPVGDASAAFGFQDCDFSDSVLGAFWEGFTNPNEDGTCRFNPGDNNDLSNATQENAYATALGMQPASQAFVDRSDNQVGMVRNTMWMNAKVQLVESYRNNSSRSAAISAAINESEQPLVHAERNTLASFESKGQTLSYLAENATVWASWSTGGGGTLAGVSNATAYANYTLANGSTYILEAPAPATAPSHPLIPDDDRTYWTSNTTSSSSITISEANESLKGYSVNNANGTETAYPLPNHDYAALMNDYQNLRSLTDSSGQIRTYLNETYSALENGSINVSDISATMPTALAYQAGSAYNRTGYHAYLNAQLAALGMSGNTTISHEVKTTWTRQTVQNGSVVWNNTTVTVHGGLFYTGDDVNAFEVNRTYNPSNLSGTAVMTVASVTHNGTALNYSSPYFWMDRNFTITEAINPETGEHYNASRVVVRNYTSSDPSGLRDDLQNASETRQYYLNLSVPSSGGGFSFDFGNGGGMLIVVAAVAVFLLGRDSN